MSSAAQDLYRAVVVEHARHPRNFGRPDGPARTAEGYNPLCGDRLLVHVALDGDGDTLRELTFEGSGCAVSTASASLMTEALRGRTTADAERLATAFEALLRGGAPASAPGETFRPSEPDPPRGPRGPGSRGEPPAAHEPREANDASEPGTVREAAAGAAALGDLAALGGVSRFPSRVKCALLAWHALRAALAARDAPVSTE